jgi:hypothetical protein
MPVKPAEFVCWVGSGFETADLVNDAKAWTWEYEAEHLLLRLVTGELAIVRGGRYGIRFIVKGEGDGRTMHMEIEGREVQVERIDWHTHPRVTGPSDGDLDALAILDQEESFIYEIGGDPNGTRITPKSKPDPPAG